MSWRPDRLAAGTVHVPPPIDVPCESVKPSGTPRMLTVRVSEPSVSTRVAERFSATA